MAQFYRKDWENYYISRSVFTDIFSQTLRYPNWHGDDADNPSTKALAEWNELRVTHFQHAVQKIIQHRRLEPIYDLTSAFVLRNPRYRLLDLLDIVANPDLKALTAEEQEAIKHAKRFYELLTDKHVEHGFEPGGYGDRVTFVYDQDDISDSDTSISKAEGSLYQLDDDQLVSFNDQEWWPLDAVAQKMYHIKTATFIDLLLKSDLQMKNFKYASADDRSWKRLVPMLKLSDVQDTINDVTAKLKNFGNQFVYDLDGDSHE